MPELLENGGRVTLWGGWSVYVPSAYHQRNEDGSWSAWGHDWAVDVTIIEIAGDASGSLVSPEQLIDLERTRTINASGDGWVGMTEVLTETDQGRSVFRLAGTLAAVNTMMLCWVSYTTERQLPFAEDLIRRVRHLPREA